MNDRQKRFFEYLSYIQESSVQKCMAEHHLTDTETESILYDVTFETITSVLEMLDGYSGFSSNRLDIVDTVTGEMLNENPTIELHDHNEDHLRYE